MRSARPILVIALLLFAATVGPAEPALAAGTFFDDDGHTFEGEIEAVAAAGITKGCNPPANDKFCPDDFVTRGQMAAFLVRAMGYMDNGGGDLFSDDDGSVFENDIDRLATAGVTKGCNPPANDKFCPDDFVTRGQMAAFLARALGLDPMIPDPEQPIARLEMWYTERVAFEGETLLVDGCPGGGFFDAHSRRSDHGAPAFILSWEWYLNGVLDSTTSDWWHVDEPRLKEGLNAVKLRVTNDAGNSDEATASVELVYFEWCP